MKKALLIILIICSIILLVSCSTFTNKTYNTMDYFDTVITLNISVKEDDRNPEWLEVRDAMLMIQNAVNVYDDGSNIYKFNNLKENSTLEISKITYDILSYAKIAYEKTSGAYNPTMYLLSDLWGFTDRFTSKEYEPIYPYDRQDPTKELPDAKYVEGFLALTDFSKIEIYEENGKYYVFKPNVSVTIDGVKYNMKLDLGGIVKGYATGKIYDVIKKFDLKYGYASLGSSSLVLFERNKKGENWTLSLKDPNEPNSIYLKTNTINSFVSTSGNYEQYYEIDGKRYCHIINPKTGYPVDNNNLSATCMVRANREDLALASLLDAYSTALMTMDLESAKQFIEKEHIDAFIALNEGGINKVYTNAVAEVVADYVRI